MMVNTCSAAVELLLISVTDTSLAYAVYMPQTTLLHISDVYNNKQWKTEKVL